MKKQKGITLIALVITIVILIILAGVAINLSIGENGILSKAKQAKEEYKKASVKEQVELAILDIQADKMSKGEECTVDDIAQELQNKVDGLTIVKTGEIAIGIYKDTEIRIDKSLNVVTTKQITASNYGDYVNYPIDLDDDGNTTNDWQIFYKEDDPTSPNYGATYIIADYYVPASKMNNSLTNAGMTTYTDSTYRVYWESAPTTYQPISDTVKQVFMYDYTGTSYDNVKCVSTLLNKDNWKDDFVTSKLKAKGGLAIGGPTINMWCASWNKKYAKNEEKQKITPSIPNTYSQGYQVNNLNSLDLRQSTVYKTSEKSIYFPTKSTASDGTGIYWIASPSSYNAEALITIHRGGYLNMGGYRSSFVVGIRPVVYLPKEILLTKDLETDNLWNINY